MNKREILEKKIEVYKKMCKEPNNVVKVLREEQEKLLKELQENKAKNNKKL